MNEWVGEDVFWVDAVDERRTPQGAGFDVRSAIGRQVAFGREAAFGPRLVGLVLVCVVLFGLATLVGFAADATAAPPGPSRIVLAPGTPVATTATMPPGRDDG